MTASAKSVVIFTISKQQCFKEYHRRFKFKQGGMHDFIQIIMLMIVNFEKFDIC